jgi:hypothetical protein
MEHTMIVSLTKKRGMKIKITDLIRSQKSNIRLRFPKDGISAKKWIVIKTGKNYFCFLLFVRQNNFELRKTF